MPAKPLPTPGPMASFKTIDAWLLNRGWERQDRMVWILRTAARVTFAVYEEAQRIQRRRDKRAETAAASGTTRRTPQKERA